MTDRDDYKRLADELDGWHDCADGDAAAGNGHFRVVCESDSEQQRLNLRATLREAAKALRAASAKAGEVKGEPVAWLRCAVEGDAPKPCNEDDDGAFPVYRAATPAASVGAMREALQFARDQLVTVCNGSTGGIPNAICALIPEAIDKIDAAIAAANQSDGGECACGNFNDGERCPGPDGQPLCARPSDTLPVPQAVEAVSVDEVFHVIAEWADNEFIETTNSSVEALARALLAKFKMEGR